MFRVVLDLVLVMVMLNVVWVLVPPTLPHRKLMFGLMMEILCYIRVGIIHPGVIYTRTGPIIHQILGGRIIMVLLVMVDVVLVLVLG